MAAAAMPIRPARSGSAHTVGMGYCDTCGMFRLGTCPKCGETTLHTIAPGTEFCEQVCENGECNRRDDGSPEFQARMKEALYQLERRERRRRH